MIRIPALSGIALAALVISGCASATDTDPDTTASVDSAVTTGERDLTPYLEQEFSWESCDSAWLIDSPGTVGVWNCLGSRDL